MARSATGAGWAYRRRKRALRWRRWHGVFLLLRYGLRSGGRLAVIQVTCEASIACITFAVLPGISHRIVKSTGDAELKTGPDPRSIWDASRTSKLSSAGRRLCRAHPADRDCLEQHERPTGR
jgi:hypothetical protein